MGLIRLIWAPSPSPPSPAAPMKIVSHKTKGVAQTPLRHRSARTDAELSKEDAEREGKGGLAGSGAECVVYGVCPRKPQGGDRRATQTCFMDFTMGQDEDWSFELQSIFEPFELHEMEAHLECAQPDLCICLGPPVPLYPFLGEGSPTKIDYRKIPLF